MKKIIKLAGILAFVVIMCFSFSACDFFSNCEICGEWVCICPDWKEFIGTWTSSFGSTYVITKDTVKWSQGSSGTYFLFSIDSGSTKSNYNIVFADSMKNYPRGFEFKGTISECSGGSYTVGGKETSTLFMHKDKKSISDLGWTDNLNTYKK